MDDLDLLLGELSREAPPAGSLAQVGPRVRARLRQRAVTRYFLAAAAMLATLILAWPRPEPVAWPGVPEFAMPAPDFALSKSVVPVPSRSRVERPKAAIVGGDKLKLTTNDPKVVIYWSL
jgi:hypothetical protein